QPFGRLAAIGLEGRVCGNGLDAHQLEKPFEAGGNAGAGAIEDGQNVGHGRIPCELRGDIRPIASARANRMTVCGGQTRGSRPRLVSTMRIYSRSSSRSK